MIFISSWPGATFCPTSTVRLLTMPFTGATIFVYCRFSCGLIEIRLLALRFGQRRRGPGARDLHLLGRGVGVALVRLRLNEFALGLRDLLLRRVGAGAGGLDTGRTGLGGGDRLIVLLLRNFLLVDQLLVAHEIVLRFHIVGFGLLQLGLGGFELLLARPECRRARCSRRLRWPKPGCWYSPR